MTNGSNGWGVKFSHISWLDNMLKGHGNVNALSRDRDILFSATRLKQSDQLLILCCNEYVMGATAVNRALSEFGKLDVIYIGGGWNSYTKQAKDLCLGSKIGLYNSHEMTGALWKDEYWSYHNKDENGDPTYYLGDE